MDPVLNLYQDCGYEEEMRKASQHGSTIFSKRGGDGPWQKKMAKKEKAKKAEFSLFAPSAKSVFLAGNFNQWNSSSHPLKRDKNGKWKVSLNLKPGRYEYRFLVDGEWQNDPSCSDFVENPFGTSNCLRIVK